MSKVYPFYRDIYYKGKLTYSYRRYIKWWKWSKYNYVVRPGPAWLKDFIVYPNYAMLISLTNKRRKRVRYGK